MPVLIARRAHAALIALLLAAVASPAAAHIQLDEPTARHTAQKRGPCGLARDPGRGDQITVYEPGQTITVRWRETINHPSHYRISFDEDGHDDFVEPAGFDDLYSGPSVLLDDISDQRGGQYSAQVTLPDLECERCTLQLVQVMYDKPPYGDGNDLYYQCADLALRRPASADMHAADLGVHDMHVHDMGAGDMHVHDMGAGDMRRPPEVQDMGLDDMRPPGAKDQGTWAPPSAGAQEGGCAQASAQPPSSAPRSPGVALGALGALGILLGRRPRLGGPGPASSQA